MAAPHSPLVQVEDWVNTPTGRRETDTMATWACSSWYFMRFADAHNSERIFDPKEVNYWLPVDMYVGGAEHAVLHLLYARMWTKVLYDLGVVGFIEPFMSLRNQGMILAPEQKEVDGRMVYEKMSKSKGNVITPDEVVAAVVEEMEILETELRIAMFAAGAGNIAALRAPGVIETV